MTQPVNPTQKSWLNPLTILIAIITLVILTAIGVFAITRHGGTTISVSKANEVLSNISKTQEDLKIATSIKMYLVMMNLELLPVLALSLLHPK